MHFNEKIKALKAHEESIKGPQAADTDKKTMVYKSKPLKANLQPFEMMQSRFNFTKPEVFLYNSQKNIQPGPPPGKYNPKYIQVLP
jgi:hypothetical protein